MSLAFTPRGYSGPSESNYLFIDGGCLRTVLQDYSDVYFSGLPIEIDFSRFTTEFSKVFYYDAIPSQKQEESDLDYSNRINPIEGLVEKLELLDRFHVYLGKSHIRRRRTEQKQVDMMIAIDMLKHTFYRNLQKATLLTSDSDFIPLLDTLVENGMSISLWYGKTKNANANQDLLKAADRRRRISIDQLIQACSSTFQRKIPVPSQMSVSKIEPYHRIYQWEQPGKSIINLGKRQEGYVIVFTSEKDNNHFTEIMHPDFNFLKIYLKEEFQVKIPDDVPPF
jgi:uncharacterized LabA/DUF88 family protein